MADLTAAFEAAMRAYIDAHRRPGEWDVTCDLWFDKTETGEYEVTRIRDAYLGWTLAATALREQQEEIARLREQIMSPQMRCPQCDMLRLERGAAEERIRALEKRSRLLRLARPYVEGKDPALLALIDMDAAIDAETRKG